MTACTGPPRNDERRPGGGGETSSWLAGRDQYVTDRRQDRGRRALAELTAYAAGRGDHETASLARWLRDAR